MHIYALCIYNILTHVAGLGTLLALNTLPKLKTDLWVCVYIHDLDPLTLQVVLHVPLGHEWQDNIWGGVWGIKTHSKETQNVGMAEVFHNEALSKESFHFILRYEVCLCVCGGGGEVGGGGEGGRGKGAGGRGGTCLSSPANTEAIPTIADSGFWQIKLRLRRQEA